MEGRSLRMKLHRRILSWEKPFCAFACANPNMLRFGKRSVSGSLAVCLAGRARYGCVGARRMAVGITLFTGKQAFG